MINTLCDYQNYRISLTEAGLTTGYFFLRDIEPPDTAIYKNFSLTSSQSYGGQIQHGFAKVTLTWNVARSKTVYLLKQYLNTPYGNRELYLTIPYNDGSVMGRRFIDVKGIAHPIDVTEGGTIPSRNGMYYENLVITLNNLIIVNNPATF